MKREEALQHVSCRIDDSLNEHHRSEQPDNARLVVWVTGYDVVVIAVWSYLGVRLEDDEAEELATDLLLEKHWFTDDEPTDADYVL